jgi:hypothetical protein
MDRVFKSGASATPPAAPTSPSTGYATAGNPSTGTPPTKPGPYWFHMITEELLAMVAAAGITFDKSSLNQVASAIQSGKLFSSSAAGTANAISASFTPAVAALKDGMVLYVRASVANTTTTPSYTPNSGTIAAKTVVKGANTALVPGDIAGAGHWLGLQYDAALDKWVLLNPATGVSSAVQAGFSNVQSFTSSGTFTIPAGVSKIKVTVVGGGGGGGNGSAPGNQNLGGGGGGAGATAMTVLSGLTPGNTLAITVGAGGAATANGTGSSVASGTQTISTVTGGGGVGGGSSGAGGSVGGTASGGALNVSGGSGGPSVTSFSTNNANGNGGSGGASTYGSGGAGAYSSASGAAGLAYGSGGGGGCGNAQVGGAGAPGVVVIEY